MPAMRQHERAARPILRVPARGIDCRAHGQRRNAQSNGKVTEKRRLARLKWQRDYQRRKRAELLKRKAEAKQAAKRASYDRTRGGALDTAERARVCADVDYERKHGRKRVFADAVDVADIFRDAAKAPATSTRKPGIQYQRN
jgi:hypothetical protein